MLYDRKSVAESLWENVFPRKSVHLNCFTNSSVIQQFSALRQLLNLQTLKNCKITCLLDYTLQMEL